MYPILKPLIKDSMRQKGITYKQLGQGIGMTEAGIKKLFQAKDCSLSRLDQITKFLGLELSSLMSYAQSEQTLEEIEIDSKTQSFLQKNPHLMDLYWLLFIENQTPAGILSRYSISKSALYKNLAELDRLGIIQWKAGDKITSGPKRPFLVKPNGPMIEQWLRRFSNSLIDDIYEKSMAIKDDQPFLAQRFLYLSGKSSGEFRQRLSDLIKEFNLRATHEQSIGQHKLQPVRVLAAFAKGSMIKELK